MVDTYIDPSRDQIETLLKLELEGPVFMLNLLRFAPDGGAEAYRRYGEQAAPFLESAGATVQYLGDIAAIVIGGEAWDEVILVRYPSVSAFLDMIGNPDYPSRLRRGTLADSRLYCTQPPSIAG